MALFLGVVAPLPIWDVVDGWGPGGTQGVYRLVTGRRRGTLWDALAHTPGYFRRVGFAETRAFHSDNLVFGVLLLATGAGVGLLCYWLVRFRR
jgi:hypothetical protein